MTPSIWIYGGVHYDPGTRQKFLEELAKQSTVPHFVAVEWEKSVLGSFSDGLGLKTALDRAGIF
jgi:hypothetical protein